MGSCSCEPFGGFQNNSIEKMAEFAQYNDTVCKVSSDENIKYLIFMTRGFLWSLQICEFFLLFVSGQMFKLLKTY